MGNYTAVERLKEVKPMQYSLTERPRAVSNLSFDFEQGKFVSVSKSTKQVYLSFETKNISSQFRSRLSSSVSVLISGNENLYQFRSRLSE